MSDTPETDANEATAYTSFNENRGWVASGTAKELAGWLKMFHASKRLLRTTHGQQLGAESYSLQATGNELENLHASAEAIESLECRLAECQAKLAEAEKDAERYRTIKKVAMTVRTTDGEEWCIEWGEFGIDEVTDLDAAIDAAKESHD